MYTVFRFCILSFRCVKQNVLALSFVRKDGELIFEIIQLFQIKFYN